MKRVTKKAAPARKPAVKKAAVKKAAPKKATKAVAKRPVAKKAVAKKPLAKKPAAKKRVGKPAVGASMRELMAHAYALETEASERYGEFAETMGEHNNREVSELFRKLARIEHLHAEQILEKMGWVEPPAPPATGWQWEGLEGPETASADSLHYLMQPYHALQIARLNEERAYAFFADLAKRAPAGPMRAAALEFAEEEREHVELIDQWIARTPKPTDNWSEDPDPPVYSD